jgi:hypothetical protein
MIPFPPDERQQIPPTSVGIEKTIVSKYCRQLLRIFVFDNRSINLVNPGRDKVKPGLKNHLESKQM